MNVKSIDVFQVKQDLKNCPKSVREYVDSLENLIKIKEETINKAPLLIASVSDSVYLTENQIVELSNIGSQHLYLDAMDEGRLNYDGVLEILKRYEELRKSDR